MKLKVYKNKDYIVTSHWRILYTIPLDATNFTVAEIDSMFNNDSSIIKVDFISWVLCKIYRLFKKGLK